MKEVPRLWISRVRLPFDAAATMATSVIVVRSSREVMASGGWGRQARIASIVSFCVIAVLSLSGT
eukprot:635196-Prymnesium_polylepis.1